MGTCLIIDDDEDTREAVARCAASVCDEVFIARGGKEGLVRAAKHKPDVVVVDLHMPRMSGIETLDALARLEPAPTPICFTGFHSNYEVQLRRFPRMPVIEKPIASRVQRAELTEAIRAALSTSRALRGRRVPSADSEAEKLRLMAEIIEHLASYRGLDARAVFDALGAELNMPKRSRDRLFKAGLRAIGKEYARDLRRMGVLDEEIRGGRG